MMVEMSARPVGKASGDEYMSKSLNSSLSRRIYGAA
jgi:hypothetical protein